MYAKKCYFEFIPSRDKEIEIEIYIERDIYPLDHSQMSTLARTRQGWPKAMSSIQVPNVRNATT